MIHNRGYAISALSYRLNPPQKGLHGFRGTWLRAGFVEWHGRFASIRPGLHPGARALHAVQQRFQG